MSHKELVELLLKRPKIKVNKKISNSGTALILASKKECREVVEILLKHLDVDINKLCNYRSNALIHTI